MTPREIKKLGAIWGGQHGLLSVSELGVLMHHVREAALGASGCLRMLEVGHYHGLSTCGIVHALLAAKRDWLLDTVDAHIADRWVGPTEPKDFLANMASHFADDRVRPIFGRSQDLVWDTREYDVVFYDGDHGDEQMRITHLVQASQRTKLFIFDDRDFAVPSECCYRLREWGWSDESPPLARLKGDKCNPETMTLGVFRRGTP